MARDQSKSPERSTTSKGARKRRASAKRKPEEGKPMPAEGRKSGGRKSGKGGKKRSPSSSVNENRSEGGDPSSSKGKQMKGIKKKKSKKNLLAPPAPAVPASQSHRRSPSTSATIPIEPPNAPRTTMVGLNEAGEYKRKRWDYVMTCEGLIKSQILDADPPPRPAEDKEKPANEEEEESGGFFSKLLGGDDEPDEMKIWERIIALRKVVKSLGLAGLNVLIMESVPLEQTFILIGGSDDILGGAAEAMELGVRLGYKTKASALENDFEAIPDVASDGPGFFSLKVACYERTDRPAKIVRISVGPQDQVAHVKRKVAAQIGADKFPLHRQLISLNGEELWNPFKNLVKLGINKDTILTITLQADKPPARSHFRRQFHMEDLEELYYEYNWQGFSGAERLQILEHKITSKLAKDERGRIPSKNGKLDLEFMKTGGAQVDVNRMLSDETLKAFFPLHDPPVREALRGDWTGLDDVFKWLPMERIRDYFGEKIAFYFMYLEFYTWAIFPLAVFGVYLFFQNLNLIADVDARNAALPDGAPEEPVINPLVLVYGMVVIIWSTAFLEFWKRKTASKAYEWDVDDWEGESEPDRAEFVKEMQRQQDIQVGSVTLTDMKLFGKFYYPSDRRRYKIALSTLTTATGCFLVFSAVFAVFLFRRLLQSNAIDDLNPDDFDDEEAYEQAQADAVANARLFASVISGVYVVILNALYPKIAEKLNDWETYRTQSEYEGALIIKLFSFQAANSYSSLFWVAFFESAAEQCLDFQNPGQDICKDPMRNLSVQLGGLLTVSQVVNAVKEMALPAVASYLAKRKLLKAAMKDDESGEGTAAEKKARAKAAKDEREAAAAAAAGATTDGKARAIPNPSGRVTARGPIPLMIEDSPVEGETPKEKKKRLNAARAAAIAVAQAQANDDALAQAEDEFGLPPSTGTMEEYAEMMLQFGFSTMFVTAFPLAPTYAFLNNIAEVRLDGFKFIAQFQRPMAEPAGGIGVWLSVLEVMSILSVITNVAVIFFVSDQYLAVPGLDFTDPESYPADFLYNPEYNVLRWLYRILALFFFEHVLILVKLALAAAIPDDPDWIREAKFQTSLFEEKKDSLAALQLDGFKNFGDLACDVCEKKIAKETHYHCQTCGKKDIDLCEEHKGERITRKEDDVNHDPAACRLVKRTPEQLEALAQGAQTSEGNECSICDKDLIEDPNSVFCNDCGEFYCEACSKEPQANGHDPVHDMEQIE